MTVRYDDVEVGTELPAQTFGVQRVNLVMYAGASGDFNPIHWNERFATAVGLPNVIAHGMFTMAEACRVVTDWVGDPGAVEEYGVRFTRPVVVPDDDAGRDARGDREGGGQAGGQPGRGRPERPLRRRDGAGPGARGGPAALTGASLRPRAAGRGAAGRGLPVAGLPVRRLRRRRGTRGCARSLRDIDAAERRGTSRASEPTHRRRAGAGRRARRLLVAVRLVPRCAAGGRTHRRAVGPRRHHPRRHGHRRLPGRVRSSLIPTAPGSR